MKFLKRLFGRGRKGHSEEEGSPLLAKELEASIAEAERLVAAGRYEEALQVADGGLKRFPTAGRLRAVVQYVRRAGANKRLSQLKQMLEERKDERAYRELIALQLELGAAADALEVANRYTQEFPNAPDAHVHLGEVHLARYFGELFARDAWAAIESLERALRLQAETIRAHALMGLLYYAVGAPRHCSASLGEVLRLDPTNTRIAEFRERVLEAASAEGEEDIEYLLDYAEDRHEIPNDPTDFPGGQRFRVERKGGALSPKLFAAAAAGIGRTRRTASAWPAGATRPRAAPAAT